MGRLKQESSPRMDAIYQYIIEYKKVNDGIPPTNREIGKHIGEVFNLPKGSLSTSVVTFYLNRLVDAGLIRRIDKKMYN